MRSATGSQEDLKLQMIIMSEEVSLLAISKDLKNYQKSLIERVCPLSNDSAHRCTATIKGLDSKVLIKDCLSINNVDSTWRHTADWTVWDSHFERFSGRRLLSNDLLSNRIRSIRVTLFWISTLSAYRSGLIPVCFHSDFPIFNLKHLHRFWLKVLFLKFLANGGRQAAIFLIFNRIRFKIHFKIRHATCPR